MRFTKYVLWKLLCLSRLDISLSNVLSVQDVIRNGCSQFRSVSISLSETIRSAFVSTPWPESLMPHNSLTRLLKGSNRRCSPEGSNNDMLESFIWKTSSSRKNYNSLQKELVVPSQLLCWTRKDRLCSQINCWFCLRVKYAGDVVKAQKKYGKSILHIDGSTQ